MIGVKSVVGQLVPQERRVHFLSSRFVSHILRKSLLFYWNTLDFLVMNCHAYYLFGLPPVLGQSCAVRWKFDGKDIKLLFISFGHASTRQNLRLLESTNHTGTFLKVTQFNILYIRTQPSSTIQWP